MALLTSTKYPHIRVRIPELKEYRTFKGGRLELDESDPAYDSMMKWASERSFVTVHDSVARCGECGEAFVGKMVAARFARHNNEKHGGEAELAASGQARVKKSTPFSCEVCQPPQAFEDAEELAVHTAALHATDTEVEEPVRRRAPAVRQGVTTSKST
jgi:class 3 adenylate cyclase